MLKFKINRRGVSPVIATLLLVAIAVAASVVTYTWAMSMTANQSQQSQTSIKIDQVRFGQAAIVSTTLSAQLEAGNGADVGEVQVVSTAGFVIGDVITIGTETCTVSAVNTGTTMTLTDDVTTTQASGQTVSKPSRNGALISIRNSGSIAATIQTIYIFQGDALISTISPVSSNVLSAGAISNFGITTATSSLDWNNLKSGGVSLPTASPVITSQVFNAALTVNSPYKIRIVTSTGFVAEGTYYAPGSFAQTS